jgi:biotin transport system substrate-specific component
VSDAKRFPVIQIVLAAFFAALSAALSQIAIPLGEVPIVLTQVSILLAGGLLGWKWGTVSQLVFVCLGMLGAPVFQGFSGGMGVLWGPTGGFIMGYILSAFTAGLLCDRLGRGKALVPVLVLADLVVYIPGVPWLMHVTGLGFKAALAAGLWPFLPADALKIVLAAILIPMLSGVLHKSKAPAAVQEGS